MEHEELHQGASPLKVHDPRGDVCPSTTMPPCWASSNLPGHACAPPDTLPNLLEGADCCPHKRRAEHIWLCKALEDPWMREMMIWNLLSVKKTKQHQTSRSWCRSLISAVFIMMSKHGGLLLQWICPQNWRTGLSLGPLKKNKIKKQPTEWKHGKKLKLKYTWKEVRLPWQLWLHWCWRICTELEGFMEKSYYSCQLWSSFSVGWTFVTPIRENYAYNSWHGKKVIISLTERWLVLWWNRSYLLY